MTQISIPQVNFYISYCPVVLMITVSVSIFIVSTFITEVCCCQILVVLRKPYFSITAINHTALSFKEKRHNKRTEIFAITKSAFYIIPLSLKYLIPNIFYVNARYELQVGGVLSVRDTFSNREKRVNKSVVILLIVLSVNSVNKVIISLNVAKHKWLRLNTSVF